MIDILINNYKHKITKIINKASSTNIAYMLLMYIDLVGRRMLFGALS